jgi:hypothetical protein
MSSGEKKIAVILAVVLVAMVGLYVSTSNKAQSAAPAGNPMMAKAGGAAAGGTQSGTGADCAPTGASDGSVATQEFGKKGAKLEIVAALPITHGCHVETEAELKKAYQKHPKDVHLTIYDLFGAEGQKYVSQHGGQRAVVFINGESTFEANGKKMQLERQENMSYSPTDLVPLIESLLKKA